MCLFEFAPDYMPGNLVWSVPLHFLGLWSRPGRRQGRGDGDARDEFDELEDARDAEDAEDLDDSDDPRVAAGRRYLHVPSGKAFLRKQSKRRSR